jgi:hypothetical protein
VAHLTQLDTEVRKNSRSYPIALTHEAEQYVLCPDIVVVEAKRLFLRQRQHPPRAFRKLVEPVRHRDVMIAQSTALLDRPILIFIGPAA